MEAKKEVTIRFTAAELISDINWEMLSGMNFLMTPFLDNTMLWYSKELSVEDLKRHAQNVKSLSEEHIEEIDFWVDHEVEELEGEKVPFIVYRFSMDDYDLILADN